MARLNRIACVLTSDFEDSEAQVPLEQLRDSGLKVDVISFDSGQKLKGKRGQFKVASDKGIDEVKVDDYAALLIPGGHSPDQLRGDDRFIEFVRAFEEAGKPIAAVCHGPQLLLSAGLVKGRTLTSWKTIQGDLRQAGATVKDEPVVIDSNWVTSRHPGDLQAFSLAFIHLLRGDQPRIREVHPPHPDRG